MFAIFMYYDFWIDLFPNFAPRKLLNGQFLLLPKDICNSIVFNSQLHFHSSNLPQWHF